MTVCQELDMILENKKKNVCNKKWSPKFIFINENKNHKYFFDSLRLRFWHCTAIPSSEHWDFEGEIKGYRHIINRFRPKNNLVFTTELIFIARPIALLVG